ncbi:MAG: outer membrane beta-barrel protein [Candidatus Pacebacteria bacterium]|nr:outer membrane beta-barrel protein [Candidatus Paceibacterota bacterium]
MKKIISVMLLVGFVMVSGAYASGKFSVKADVGYTTLNLGDFNSYLDEQKSMEETFGSTATVTKSNIAFVVGIGLDYKVSPVITVGPKIEYIKCNQEKIHLLMDVSGTPANADIQYDAYVTPVLVGATYGKPLNEKLDLSGSLYLGEALANSKLTVTQQIGSVSASMEVPYDGSALQTEIGFGGSYKINKSFAISLNLAYRNLVVSNLKASKDIPELYIHKGDPIMGAGQSINIDLGGIALGGGIKYIF